MSHSVKIYDTCNRYSQCVRACLIVVPKMIPWMDVKLKEEISGYSYGLEGLSSNRIDEKWNID